MYAVIKTGGKQYAVEPGDRLFIERLDAEPGTKLAFDRVLYLNADDSVQVGTPYLDAVRVLATVIENGKSKKVVTFKYKAKKDYRKKQGHRQPYTLVEIDAVTAEGNVIAEKPAPKIEEAAIPEEPEATETESSLAEDAAEPAPEESEAAATEEIEAEKVEEEKIETEKAAERPAKAEKPAADAAEKPVETRTAKPKAEKAEADKAGLVTEKPKRTAKPKAEKTETKKTEAETAEKPAAKRTAKPKEKKADAAPAVTEEEK